MRGLVECEGEYEGECEGVDKKRDACSQLDIEIMRYNELSLSNGTTTWLHHTLVSFVYTQYTVYCILLIPFIYLQPTNIDVYLIIYNHIYIYIYGI